MDFNKVVWCIIELFTNKYKFQNPSYTVDDVYLICILTIILMVVIFTFYAQNKKIKYWTGFEGSSFWTKQLIINQNLTIKQRISFTFYMCTSVFIIFCIAYLITHESSVIIVGLLAGLFGGTGLYTGYKKQKTSW